MAKKRAFVRYSKNGKLVPGSLIVTQGTHPDKPSTWKEVPYDICCGGGDCPLLEIQVYYSINSETICSGQATLGTYYMDCTPISFFPLIFLDSQGNIPAPTGYYSFVNGITNTILYIVNGVSQYFAQCA